jgi:hypothetical protein
MAMEEDEQVVAETDPIEQEQVALDAEQGGETAASVPATAEQMAQVMQVMQNQAAENATLRSQVQGLQGKIDTGLNAIRRDTKAQAEERIKQADQQNRELHLRNVAEQNPELSDEMRRFYSNQDLIALERAQLMSESEPQPETVPVQSNPADDMDALRVWVSNMGGNPDASGIDYQAALNPQVSVTERQNVFMRQVIAAQPKAAQASAASNGQATQSPPPAGGANVGKGRFTNFVQVADAFQQGIIDRDIYQTEASRFGVNV